MSKFPEKSLAWGQSKNCMRELAAYGNIRKAQIGAENVYDFSLGNPNVPTPPVFEKALRDALEEFTSGELHGYTPASGLPSFRKAIAESLNRRFGMNLTPDLIYVTHGASTGLIACSHGLMFPGEEAITFAPYFTEYAIFVQSAGGKLVPVMSDKDFQPDFDAFEKAINEKTKLVIINSPNNPTGVVLTEESYLKLAKIMKAAEEKFGHPIYLVSDEPYRELIFNGTEILCPANYYDNTIICYSWSKSLSIPGERIGYLAVSDKMEDKELVFAALAGGARACGYINPPSMIQRVVEKCIDETSDLSQYKKNRDLLYEGLTALNFDCVKPDGAFYLFMKCPIPDAKEFSDRAKKYEILVAPSNDFGITGYVRVAYCVSTDTIVNSMPAFRKLAEEFGLI